MIIYGKQLFLHILHKYPQKVKSVYLAKELEPKLFHTVASCCKQIERVDNKKAQALAKGGNHQGFLADIEPLELSSFEQVKSGNFIVILDGLSDVGNIGAIIRTSYAFGADALVLTNMKSVALEGVVRTSSAAAFELPLVLYPNALDLMNELKQVGFSLYGADMNGLPVHEIEFSSKIALFMGSEGDGLHKKVKRKLDSLVSVKMVRVFDSLNVSAATAVICDRIANG